MRVQNAYDVPSYNPQHLMQYVNRGAVTVGIEADQNIFYHYSGGIMSSSSGCGHALDHAVVVVGYGSGYFIVRNSWGSSWGEQGYIRMAIENGNGTCGINMAPMYPTTN